MFFFIKGCTKSSIGAFQCGFNAGGQVACDGFSNNPQYLLTVNEGMCAPILYIDELCPLHLVKQKTYKN